MAVRRAVASGNWSDPATWDGGTTIPGNGDTVYTNGYTVTIDQNVEIGSTNNPIGQPANTIVTGGFYRVRSGGTPSLTTFGAPNENVGTLFRATANGSGTATVDHEAAISNEAVSGVSASGGGISCSSGTFNVWAQTRSGTSVLLTATGTSSLSIIGAIGFVSSRCMNLGGSGNFSIISPIVVNSSNGASSLVNYSGSGTLTIVGNLFVTSAVPFNYPLSISGDGAVTIIGNVEISGATQQHGINNTKTGGVLVITGNLTATSSNTQSSCVSNTGAGSVIINGNLQGSSAGSPALYNSVAVYSTVAPTTINGNIYAGATSAGFYSPNNVQHTLNASVFDHQSGMQAVICVKKITGSSLNNKQYRTAGDGVSTFNTLYTSDFSGFDLPATSNVRNGIVYASGSQTGTCYVPSASSVAYGVPVDNTTGTAVLTPENIKAAIWDQDVTQLTTPNSIGARLKNASTVETTGSQIATAISV